MESFALFEGIVLSLWAILSGNEGVHEIIRILENKTEYLRARKQDIERESLSAGIQRSKKRNREDDHSLWVAEAGKLLEGVQHVLTEAGKKERNFLMCAKMRKTICRNIEALVGHEKKGDLLFRNGWTCGAGPSCDDVIPVNELFGQAAATNLEKLQSLLLDNNVGRIAIHGIEGIGKTILMKNLHYRVLKWVDRFDYVFWISFPKQFSIKHIQDAVAVAVKCDLSNVDDLITRAKKLSHVFANLGRFVLFLDAAPEESFSLEEVGIPVPTEGSVCKLVLTTNSTLVCGLLDCVKQVKLDPLTEEEACQFFMYKAGIHEGSSSSIKEVAKLLAKECSGVPRKIVDRATRMCGIDDICEWDNALFESRNIVKENKLSFMNGIDEIERDSKKPKKDVVHAYPIAIET